MAMSCGVNYPSYYVATLPRVSTISRETSRFLLAPLHPTTSSHTPLELTRSSEYRVLVSIQMILANIAVLARVHLPPSAVI